MSEREPFLDGPPKDASCLACGCVREPAVWNAGNGAYVCRTCRATVVEVVRLKRVAHQLISNAAWGDVENGVRKVEVRDADMDKLSEAAGPIPKDFYE